MKSANQSDRIYRLEDVCDDRFLATETIDGGRFDDAIIGNQAIEDRSVGVQGLDSLSDCSRNDILLGDDSLFGGFGDDGLAGGDADDTLVGGHGNDAMMGSSRIDCLQVSADHNCPDVPDELVPAQAYFCA